MGDIQHAQRYRSMRVIDLVEYLEAFRLGDLIFPHPVTGALVVTRKDGSWVEIIRATPNGEGPRWPSIEVEEWE